MSGNDVNAAPRLVDLNGLIRFCGWQTALVGGREKPTKIPYMSAGWQSKANDPDTWLSLDRARDVAAALERPYGAGGIGVWLGGLGVGGAGRWAGWGLGGIDLDSCIGALGLADWASAVLDTTRSYSEISPSGGGVKVFFAYRMADFDGIKRAFGIGSGGSGCKWVQTGTGGGSEHPPGFEIYLERRFFALTGDALGGVPAELRVLEVADVAALVGVVRRGLGLSEKVVARGVGIADAGSAYVGGIGSSGPADLSGMDSETVSAIRERLAELLEVDRELAGFWNGDRGGMADTSRSGVAFRLVSLLKGAGWPESDVAAVVAGWCETAGWFAEKAIDTDGRPGREWIRLWERVGSGWTGGWGAELLRGVALPDPGEGWRSTDKRPGEGGEKRGSTESGSVGAERGNGTAGTAEGGRNESGELALPDGLRRADGKRVIQIKNDTFAETVALTEQMLAEDGWPVYSRGGVLVTPDAKTVITEVGEATAPGFTILRPGGLRRFMGMAASWRRLDGRVKELVPVHPPMDIVSAILQWQDPRPFLEIAGVMSGPLLHRDGTVSMGPGFDRALHVYQFSDKHLVMPVGWSDKEPVKANAVAALALLNGLLDGFPFVDAMDRSVALAFILTSVARTMLGTAPVFAISAPTAGTGKSLLVDLASVIATGQRCAVASAGQTEEETEKRLGSLVMAGHPVVSLDNVNGVLRSTLLNQVSSQERVSIRILGQSTMLTVNTRAVFVVNGNSVILSGDLIRRVLTCLMDAQMERPETRSFAFDPVEMVERNRGLYLAAAITLLRAHIAAGLPGAAGLTPLGSYGTWSTHVRGTLVWVGMPDPVLAMDRARDDDPDLKMLRDVFTGWARVLGAGEAKTCKEAADAAVQTGTSIGPVAGENVDVLRPVDALHPKDGPVEPTTVATWRRDFQQSLLSVASVRGVVDTRVLGRWLSRNNGRIVKGLKLERKKGALGIDRWAVIVVKPKLNVVKSDGHD